MPRFCPCGGVVGFSASRQDHFGPRASFYRTQAGAELDLVLETPQGQITAIEFKRTLSPKLTRGMQESMVTVGADHGVIVIPQGERYPLSKTVEVVGLWELLQTLV